MRRWFFTQCSVKLWSSLTQQDEDAKSTQGYSGKLDNTVEMKSIEDTKNQKTHLALELPYV